jgi:hypothetical protein
MSTWINSIENRRTALVAIGIVGALPDNAVVEIGDHTEHRTDGTYRTYSVCLQVQARTAAERDAIRACFPYAAWRENEEYLIHSCKTWYTLIAEVLGIPIYVYGCTEPFASVEALAQTENAEYIAEVLELGAERHEVEREALCDQS